MIRGFWRWMRVISPAEKVVGFTVGTLLALTILTSLPIYVVLPSLSTRKPEIGQSLIVFQAVLLTCSGAVAYGAMRVFYFHPIGWPDYRRWLMSTPWQPTNPLPFGPVRLIPQDAIWMLVLTVSIAPMGSIALLALPTFVALMSYLLVSTLYVHHAGPYCAAYSLSILAFVLVNLAGRLAIGSASFAGNIAIILAMGAVVCGLVVISQIGLNRQIRRFPWTEELVIRTSILKEKRQSDRTRTSTTSNDLEWPLRAIGPRRTLWKPYRKIEHVAQAFTYCAIIYLIFDVVRFWLDSDLVRATQLSGWEREKFEEYRNVLAIAPTVVLFLFVTLRPLVFQGSYKSPLNTWARLCLLRPIIPGYDIIYVTPLVSILITVVGVALATLSPWNLEVGVLTTFVALTILLIGPPDLMTWRLTGHHRISEHARLSTAKSPDGSSVGVGRPYFWN